MLEYLPQFIIKELKKFNISDINEIRIREDTRISVLLNGVNYKLNVKASRKDIEEIVYKACQYSIYSYEEDIKNGFITTNRGERIGLAGEFVIRNNCIIAIKNFSSLVVRIPKEIDGFSSDFYKKVYDYDSLLVVSKTGAGKTTFIRDLIKNLSNDNVGDIVVIDERNEIASKNNQYYFNLGENVDVLTYSNKSYGFFQAIRSLNPSYIITDELMSLDDSNGVIRAVNSGVKVIATVHASSVSGLNKITFIKPLIENKCFSLFVYIENDKGNRKIVVYDNNLLEICSF